MRPNRCPGCYGANLESNHCIDCGWQLAFVDGFPAYAPELARSGDGFDPALHAELASLEARNFWFRARNKLIVHALKTRMPTMGAFLEIGCGTGYVLSDIINAFPTLDAMGSELFTEGLGYAANRLPSVSLMQMDARRIPFRDCLDVVGAFDVLEHIAEDEHVLREIHGALKPQGMLLLTVPQHPWLWSRQDEYAHHVRRYHRRDLKAKLENAGYAITWETSFVTLLLPLLMVSRMSPWKRVDDDPFVEFRIPRWLDASLYGVLRAEASLINAGIRLPVGGSLMIAATKRSA